MGEDEGGNNVNDGRGSRGIKGKSEKVRGMKGGQIIKNDRKGNERLGS